MKRDMDACKQIARAVRDTQLPISNMPGMTQEVFFRHAKHLDELGLAVVVVQEVQGRVTAAVVRRLTALGVALCAED